MHLVVNKVSAQGTVWIIATLIARTCVQDNARITGVF